MLLALAWIAPLGDAQVEEEAGEAAGVAGMEVPPPVTPVTPGHEAMGNHDVPPHTPRCGLKSSGWGGGGARRGRRLSFNEHCPVDVSDQDMHHGWARQAAQQSPP